MTTSLRHEAFIYGSEDEFLRIVVPFVRDGLEEGSGVVVASTEANRKAVAGSLGKAASEVMFVPGEMVYTSIHGAVKAYHGVLAEMARRGHPTVRAVGEVAYDALTANSTTDALAYEAIAHSVFSTAPLHVVCPYDTRVLGPALVEHARRTHPLIIDPDGARESDEFVDPPTLLGELWSGGEVPPDPDQTVIQIRAGIPAVREIRRAITALLGTTMANRADDAMLAIGEVLANAAMHGTGHVLGSVWTNGDLVHCRIENAGPHIEDVCAGFRPPADPERGGMGLWIARQIADDLHISRGANGPAVTLTFRR